MASLWEQQMNSMDVLIEQKRWNEEREDQDERKNDIKRRNRMDVENWKLLMKEATVMINDQILNEKRNLEVMISEHKTQIEEFLKEREEEQKRMQYEIMMTKEFAE